MGWIEDKSRDDDVSVPDWWGEVRCLLDLRATDAEVQTLAKWLRMSFSLPRKRLIALGSEAQMLPPVPPPSCRALFLAKIDAYKEGYRVPDVREIDRAAVIALAKILQDLTGVPGSKTPSGCVLELLTHTQELYTINADEIFRQRPAGHWLTAVTSESPGGPAPVPPPPSVPIAPLATAGVGRGKGTARPGTTSAAPSALPAEVRAEVETQHTDYDDNKITEEENRLLEGEVPSGAESSAEEGLLDAPSEEPDETRSVEPTEQEEEPMQVALPEVTEKFQESDASTLEMGWELSQLRVQSDDDSQATISGGGDLPPVSTGRETPMLVEDPFTEREEDAESDTGTSLAASLDAVPTTDTEDPETDGLSSTTDPFMGCQDLDGIGDLAVTAAENGRDQGAGDAPLGITDSKTSDIDEQLFDMSAVPFSAEDLLRDDSHEALSLFPSGLE